MLLVDSSGSTMELVKLEKSKRRINMLWVIRPMLLSAFDEIFFSSLSCVVRIFCVWEGGGRGGLYSVHSAPPVILRDKHCKTAKHATAEYFWGLMQIIQHVSLRVFYLSLSLNLLSQHLSRE